MSAKNYSVISAIILSALTSISSTAHAGETVTGWDGVVEDLNGSHDPEHTGDHPLKFTRASDGKSFLIVEGYEGLLKEHLRSDKSLVAKIDGRITSKFLFFGGNMVVQEANETRELAQVEHRKVYVRDNLDRPRGSSNRR